MSRSFRVGHPVPLSAHYENAGVSIRGAKVDEFAYGAHQVAVQLLVDDACLNGNTAAARQGRSPPEELKSGPRFRRLSIEAHYPQACSFAAHVFKRPAPNGLLLRNRRRDLLLSAGQIRHSPALDLCRDSRRFAGLPRDQTPAQAQSSPAARGSSGRLDPARHAQARTPTRKEGSHSAHVHNPPQRGRLWYVSTSRAWP